VIAAAEPGERAVAVAQAAANGESWMLSDACTQMTDLSSAVPAGDCEVRKDRFDNNPRTIGPAEAAQRKLAVLTEYVASLNALASAQSEGAVTSAWAAAVSSAKQLAAASGSNGLGEFVGDLEASKPKTDALVSFAIRSLRYAKLKDVVTASDAAVFEVSRAVQLELQALDADPEFTRLAGALKQADTNALGLNETTPETEYRETLTELERAHIAFMKHYDTSIYVQVGRIGTAHRTLSDALRSPGSAEAVVTYLEELKGLANALEN
jgi:hypothetical protein